MIPPINSAIDNGTSFGVPYGQKYFLAESEYSRRKDTDTLVIHCADTTKDMDVGVREIREWHVKENGWKDIGYHLVIRRNGFVEVGRPLWSVGAHVQGHNSTSIGICMVGGSKRVKGANVEENNFTDAQWKTLLRLVKTLVNQFTITTICGHRDFPKVQKYCPSFDVAQWLKDNKREFGADS